jgi:hypothetical protein
MDGCRGERKYEETQVEDKCSQGMPEASRSWEKGMEQREEPNHQHLDLGFLASRIVIHLYYIKSPSLWDFVTATQGISYQRQ